MRLIGSSYQIANVSYGFRQGDDSGKAITDDTIWYFYVEKPALPPVSDSAKVCRFYALDPFLALGYTVDDITTAIKTGWDMMGLSAGKDVSPESAEPSLSFHKDTKLLIAVGEPSKLETVDAVLKALREAMPIKAATPHPPFVPPPARPGEKPNADK